MENKDSIKVCLIDDHELLRNGLARIIDRFEGYEVIFEADHGEDFIRQLPANETPDIILLDLHMPIMDGFQTGAWLRDNLPDAKILVLSMTDHESSVIRMLQYGARGYILKDIKPAELLAAFEHIMQYGYYSNDLLSGKHIHLAMEGRASEITAFRITPREMEFLQYVCTDLTYKEIAQKMQTHPRTVDNYRESLFEKFDIKSRVGLALFAIKNGFYRL